MIETLMKNLDVTEEEAKKIIEYDKAVDRMTLAEANSDLTPEQKETIKKYKNVATKKKVDEKKPFIPKLDKRPRKENKTKRSIIVDIFEGLKEKGYGGYNLTILKPEKEITFELGEDNYSISLTCHRKPKAK